MNWENKRRIGLALGWTEHEDEDGDFHITTKEDYLLSITGSAKGAWENVLFDGQTVEDEIVPWLNENSLDWSLSHDITDGFSFYGITEYDDRTGTYPFFQGKNCPGYTEVMMQMMLEVIKLKEVSGE